MKKSNPFGLAKKQHFHQKRIVDCFLDSNRFFEIKLANSPDIKKYGPKNTAFLSSNLWDELTEKEGFSHKIEKKMNGIVEDALDGRTDYLNRDHLALTRYSCLWRARHYIHKYNFINTVNKIGSKQEDFFIQTYSEKLEKNLYRNFYSASSRLRSIRGMYLMIIFNILYEKNKSLEWTLYSSNKAEFLSSDCYHKHPMIPVSEKLIFVGNLKSGCIDRQLISSEVRDLNKLTLNDHYDFYFSKKISNCPI